MTPYRLVVIMRKVRRDPEGCWEWTGGLDKDGYGVVGVDGTTHRAHRVVYEHKVGPISDGAVLHHVCHNRRCVRPDHLESMDPSAHSRQHDHPRRPLVTHCLHGHPYDEANTQYHGRGRRRVCGECSRERDRRRKAAKLDRIRALWG